MERAPSFLPEPDPRERALARTLGIPDLLARVLLARGMEDPEMIRRHLRHDLSQLHDPLGFCQMSLAVERVQRAVREGETILVHGDYDVDGITGTVLLLSLFACLQADAKPFIPSRADGYSFSAASLRAVEESGASLCISVDNGTNAGHWIDRIQQTGCDVIVTDHHGTAQHVANAFVVLNPKLPDAGYPDPDLAGVGVAFRLASALAQSFTRGASMEESFGSWLIDAMAYVALGTIADVAPLRGENRTLVHHGLQALAASTNPGIRALLDAANIGSRTPNERDVAFRIGPLINAAGRMGRASQAVDLLMARDSLEALEAARRLEQHNDERRRVERALLERLQEPARNCSDSILVLGDEGWHPGVIGIVAARLCDQFLKPVILVSFADGIGRGSGRSAGLLDLRAAVAACSSSLQSHGGHVVAVGLEIEQPRFETFRRLINEKAGHLVRPRPPIQPECSAKLSDLEPRDVRKLNLLGPFGQGNRRPTFQTTGLNIVGLPTIDSRDASLRFRVAQNGIVLPVRFKGAAARFEELRKLRAPVTLVYSPHLAFRAENGPVELHAHDLARTALDRP